MGEEDSAMTSTMRYLNSFPEGYRFCPTDEELIIHYLKNKILNKSLPPNKIRAVNLYGHSPQDLSVMYGEEEDRTMYFFTSRDRKYPNGNRPRRSAGNGFWKATGVDTPIGPKKDPIGFRKALSYYIGKPKDCTKTSWIMHEYRLNQKTPQKPAPDKNVAAGGARDMKLDDWVLCKVYLNRNSDKKNQTAIKMDSGSTSSVPQLQFNVPNNIGSTGSAPPMPADIVGFSTSSSVPQRQFNVPINIGSNSSAPPMPADVGFSAYSSVPQSQFNVPNNIGSTSYAAPVPAVTPSQFNVPNNIFYSTSSAPPTPANVVGFSTSSSVAQRHLFNVPNNVFSISSAPPTPADVVGFSTSSPVPQRQLFNVPNNLGSVSSAPPMQTTSHSSNIQQDQLSYTEYSPSSYLEDDGNSFFAMLEEDPYPPFGDDINGPNKIC